jgi:hypothetical protein
LEENEKRGNDLVIDNETKERDNLIKGLFVINSIEESKFLIKFKNKNFLFKFFK